MGFFGAKKIQVFENGLKSILPNKLGIWLFKNHIFIVYACCLNKTTKNSNKTTSEQFSWHFFLITRYLGTSDNHPKVLYCSPEPSLLASFFLFLAWCTMEEPRYRINNRTKITVSPYFDFLMEYLATLWHFFHF